MTLNTKFVGLEVCAIGK